MTMPIEGRSVEHTSEALCPCHRRHGQAVIVERGRARVRCGIPALAGMALPGSAVGRGHNAVSDQQPTGTFVNVGTRSISSSTPGATFQGSSASMSSTVVALGSAVNTSFRYA